MSGKTLAEYESEYQKIKNNISELNKQNEEIKKDLFVKNSAIEQLQKEQENLMRNIKSAGFFNFKENKPYKTKLNETKSGIKNNEKAIIELEDKNGQLSRQISDLQNQLVPIQRAKEEKEKEEKWKNDLRSGNISCDAELDKIGYELKKCLDNVQEFIEKQKLFSEWMKVAGAFGTSSPQANDIWSQAHTRYYCSPLDSIRNHKIAEYPYSLVDKLEMIRGVQNDTRVNSMINDFKIVKNTLNEIKQVQWSANRQ